MPSQAFAIVILLSLSLFVCFYFTSFHSVGCFEWRVKMMLSGVCFSLCLPLIILIDICFYSVSFTSSCCSKNVLEFNIKNGRFFWHSLRQLLLPKAGRETSIGFFGQKRRIDSIKHTCSSLDPFRLIQIRVNYDRRFVVRTKLPIHSAFRSRASWNKKWHHSIWMLEIWRCM